MMTSNMLCVESDSKEKCQGTPLFLACDVMPGNSNMSRISNKYGRLGMAAKFVLKDFHLDGYSKSSALWFFTIHGLFELAFSYHLRSLQKECIQHLSDLWLKSYNAKNLSSETIEVTLENTVMNKAMSSFKLISETATADSDNCLTQPDKIPDNGHTKLGEGTGHDQEEIASVGSFMYDQFKVTQKEMDNSNVDTTRNYDSIRTNKNPNVRPLRDTCVKTCKGCGKNLICTTCNLNCPKNLRITENHTISNKLSGNIDKPGKCCLCFQNLNGKNCNIDQYKICSACLKSVHTNASNESVTNGRQKCGLKSQECCSVKCAKKTCIEKEQSGVGIGMFKCQFCDKLNGYSGQAIKKKSEIYAITMLDSLLPWDDLYNLLQRVLHIHLSVGEHLEKCLSLLELLNYHFRASDEDEGFDLDFLKFCCVKFKDSNIIVDRQDYDLEFSRGKVKFLTIVSMWLGSEFNNCSTTISRRVDEFKQQHINCIDNLPPANEIVDHIFPVFMSALLLHWQGFSSIMNELNETQLMVEHNYNSKKSKMEDFHTGPNYPLIQLILEFANNALISGVAHVVFSKIKYTK